MRNFFIFIRSFFASFSRTELPAPVRASRRRRSPDRRARKSVYPSKFVRRIVRHHEKGLKCRSRRAVDHWKQKWASYLDTCHRASRRGFLMKNRIRCKIGRHPLRWFAYWKSGIHFNKPFEIKPKPHRARWWENAPDLVVESRVQ